MLRITFILTTFFCAIAVRSQSIKEFYRLCNTVPLNSKFNSKMSTLPYEYDKYSYGKTYRLQCEKVKTLYNVPIEKVLIHVIENDTVNAIQIYLPFDSTLHKRIEAELGPSETAWMVFSPGQLDTAGIIWDRRWFIDDYILWFRCTRYIPLVGDLLDDKILLIRMPRFNPAHKPHVNNSLRWDFVYFGHLLVG